MTPRKQTDQSLAAVKKLVQSLLGDLTRLDSLLCPYCGSRRLTIVLSSQSSIKVTCDGTVARESLRSYEDWQGDIHCSFEYVHETVSQPSPRNNLVALTFDGEG